MPCYTIKVFIATLFISILLRLVNLNVAFASAEMKQDTAVAHFYLNKAHSLYKSGAFDSAIFYYDKSSLIFDKHNLLESYFKSRIKVASTLRRQRKLDSAISYSKRLVKEIMDRMGSNTLLESSALEVIGNCYNIQSEFDQALEYQLKIVEIRKNLKDIPKLHLADAYSNLAITYFRKGYIELSLESFEATLEIRKQEYGMDHLLVADAYHNLGFFYYLVGEQDLSLEYYMISLSIYEKLYGGDHYELGNIYNGIGQVLEFKRKFNEALTYYNKALLIGKEAFGENHYLVADAYTNIASVSFKKHDYKKALDYNLKTLLVNKTLYGENGNIATSNSYIQIGLCHQELGNKLLASENLNNSKNVLETIFKEKNPELSTIHNTLGLFHLNFNNPDSALFHFQQAIIFNVVDFDKSEFSFNPNLENHLDKNILLNSLYNKAYSLVEKYKTDGDQRHLTLALSTFQLSDKLNDKIRNSKLLSSDRLVLGNTTFKIYEEALHTCYRLYELTKDVSYLNLAFYFSEKNKSNFLLESISDLKAKNYASIPDSLIRREENLQHDISFFQSKLLNKKNSEKVVNNDALEAKLFELKREHEDILRQFEINYPNYHQLKYFTKTASIKWIQTELLEANQALLEYFVSDSNYYIFAITWNDYEVYKVGVDSTFHTNFDNFRSGLITPRLTKQTLESFNLYATSAYYLYEKLLLPVEDFIKGKELIIIPDGKLALIPFEAVLTNAPKVENVDYTTLAYLLKQHNVHYANSATASLNNLASRGRVKNSNNILAFAPSFENKLSGLSKPDTVRSTLGSLGWTEQEVKGLSAHFEGVNYLGKDATETIFKEKVGQYGVIHIASHSLIDDQNPMYSKIAFSLDSKDTLNDGYLHTFELYNTRLNAEMAVLSACNTGYGKVQKGEGVMSLGHAFTYAGVPSVVMSHWQVDDRSTSIFMNSFYKYLAEGMTKSEALRSSKIDLLNNGNLSYSHPYYWAAFVAYGDDSSIESDSNTWVWSIILSLIGFLLIIIYVKKLR